MRGAIDWNARELLLGGHHGWSGTADDDAIHVAAINLATSALTPLVTGEMLRSYFSLTEDAKFMTATGVVPASDETIAFSVLVYPFGTTPEQEEYLLFYNRTTQQISTELINYKSTTTGEAALPDYLVADPLQLGSVVMGDWEDGTLKRVDTHSLTLTILQEQPDVPPAIELVSLSHQKEKLWYYSMPRERDEFGDSDYLFLQPQKRSLRCIDLVSGEVEELASYNSHETFGGIDYAVLNPETEQFIGMAGGFPAIWDIDNDQVILFPFSD